MSFQLKGKGSVLERDSVISENPSGLLFQVVPLDSRAPDPLQVTHVMSHVPSTSTVRQCE